MKAELTSSGNLKIIPETGLEEYALYKWWEGYGCDGGIESTLQVCFFDSYDAEEAD